MEQQIFWLELFLKVIIYSVVSLMIGWFLFYVAQHWIGHSVRDRLDRQVFIMKADPLLGMALWFNIPSEQIFITIVGLVNCLPSKSVAVIATMVNRYFVVLTKASSVEKLLNNNQLVDKGFEYNFLSKWLGEGLLLSKGTKWTTRRKMLTSAFHFRILDNFIEIFNEQSLILINKIKQISSESQIINILPPVSLCTLDIICETAMGKRINAQSQSDSEYIEAVYQISDVISARIFRPWLYPDITFNLSSFGRKHKKCLQTLHRFSEQVIQDRKLEYQKEREECSKQETDNDDSSIYMNVTKRRRLAFLDLLIEASDDGKLLDDLDIREEVDTFMFEGHDTTAMAITWTIFLLGASPEHQMKVQEELYEIFGQSTRLATAADLTKMKYLEMCIKEALRIYPSVPIIARDVKEDMDFCGYGVKGKRSTFVVIPYMLHREKDVFPNPEVFDPNRFLPENSHQRHPYSYVPFSAGPRNCIGQRFAIMEEKTVLSTFFRHYYVEAVDKREDIVLVADLILRPKDGVRIKIIARELDEDNVTLI